MVQLEAAAINPTFDLTWHTIQLDRAIEFKLRKRSVFNFAPVSGLNGCILKEAIPRE